MNSPEKVEVLFLTRSAQEISAPAGNVHANDAHVGAAVAYRHLLVPIKRPEQAVHAASYAKRLTRLGFSVRVSLLFVAPESEALRQYDASDSAPPEDRQARLLLARAAAFFTAENIPSEALVRYGDVVFTILDIAEQLDCHEIVLPPVKHSFLPGFMSNSVGNQLTRRTHCVPVVTVSARESQQGLK